LKGTPLAKKRSLRTKTKKREEIKKGPGKKNVAQTHKFEKETRFFCNKLRKKKEKKTREREGEARGLGRAGHFWWKRKRCQRCQGVLGGKKQKTFQGGGILKNSKGESSNLKRIRIPRKSGNKAKRGAEKKNLGKGEEKESGREL